VPLVQKNPRTYLIILQGINLNLNPWKDVSLLSLRQSLCFDASIYCRIVLQNLTFEPLMKCMVSIKQVNLPNPHSKLLYIWIFIVLGGLNSQPVLIGKCSTPWATPPAYYIYKLLNIAPDIRHSKRSHTVLLPWFCFLKYPCRFISLDHLYFLSDLLISSSKYFSS
jgi:hypothetical protein